jgi:hypothetical protein
MSGEMLPLLGLEHVKNKGAVIHSHISWTSRAPVVNKAAQSRRMRSSDAGFVKACYRESCVLM